MLLSAVTGMNRVRLQFVFVELQQCAELLVVWMHGNYPELTSHSLMHFEWSQCESVELLPLCTS